HIIGNVSYLAMEKHSSAVEGRSNLREQETFAVSGAIQPHGQRRRGEAMARPKAGEEKDRPIHMGFRVPEWVRAGLDLLAKKQDCPVSDVANEALIAHLKRNGIKAP